MTIAKKVVYTATPLVWRIEEWQHSPLTTLVVNRLLALCPLGQVAKWMEDTSLHLLLGIPNPRLLNY